MAMIRLDQPPGTHGAFRYSVVGQKAVGEKAATSSVSHVGILVADEPLTAGSTVGVLQMKPPLEIGQPGGGHGTMIAHIVGFVDDLTRDERTRIEIWLAERRTYPVPCKYLVKPASGIVKDAVSDVVVRWWFSCAGFVERCYAEGASILLVPEESLLPEVDAFTVSGIWGETIPERLLARALARCGLAGSGPWRLLLPGYLLHALDRPREALPYHPVQGDWSVPSLAGGSP